MSDSDESMGSASEYSYHSDSEEEDREYTGGAKKCSPTQNKGEPYALLNKSDLTQHKDEVGKLFFFSFSVHSLF